MSKKRGTFTGKAKHRFNREEVLSIRKRACGKKSEEAIAKEYGVSWQCIYQITSQTSYASIVERPELEAGKHYTEPKRRANRAIAL